MLKSPKFAVSLGLFLFSVCGQAAPLSLKDDGQGGTPQVEVPGLYADDKPLDYTCSSISDYPKWANKWNLIEPKRQLLLTWLGLKASYLDQATALRAKGKNTQAAYFYGKVAQIDKLTPSLGRFISKWESDIINTMKSPSKSKCMLEPHQVQLSSTSLSFPATTVGSSSSMEMTITNTGSAAYTATAVAASGTDSAMFTITSNTCTAVAASATCKIGVSFSPVSTGSKSATITLTDNAFGHSFSVAGSGL